MISPELLRRYPFFGFLDDHQLKAVAMIAEEVTFKTDEIIVRANQPADTLYFMVAGSASNYFVVDDGSHGSKEFYIGDISEGEIFGISALIEPYVYSALIRSDNHSRAIKINAAALRALCQLDVKMAYCLMNETAKALMQRLEDTRIQLAAAYAEPV